MSRDCRCGRLTRDEAFCCETCAEELRVALGDVPWLSTELDTTISRQRGIDYAGIGVRSTSCTPAADPRASQARDHLRALLVSWTRFCFEEHVRTPASMPGALTDLPADTLAAMSRWLLWRVDGLMLNDIGPEAVAELTNAVAWCRRSIDLEPERWFAGPCECGADLYAKARDGMVKCAVCALAYDVAARRAWLLAEAEDRLANAATLARSVSWLGGERLTAERVRKWAERGRIVAKMQAVHGPLYRIGDALDLLAQESRRATSSGVA